MMVIWAAMAMVKAMRSAHITDILWKKNRRPNCRVNRQDNRKQTIAQDVPHQPFSQILIILMTIQLSQRKSFCWGGLCQLIIFLNGYGCTCSSGKLLLLYSSLYTSVCLPGKLPLYMLPSLAQFYFVSNFWLGKYHRYVYFVLFFQRTKTLAGHNLRKSNA